MSARDPNPDVPDRRTFVEPVTVTNDRLAVLNPDAEAYVVTDDGGAVLSVHLTYEAAVAANRGAR